MAIEISLYDTIGTNYPDGILQPVEPGYLRENCALGIDAVARKHLRDKLLLQFAILFRKRIDGRVKKVLRNRKLPRKLRRRKHRTVIFRDKLLQKIPYRPVGMRQIDMTAPHPMIRSWLARLDERRRLRIVDDHEFAIQRELLAIPLVVGQENIKVFLARMIRRSMQRIVERFGYLKKIFAAAYYFPFDVQVQLFRQRHQASEDFRHAAANGRRIHHLDAPPMQRARQRPQLLDFTRAKQLGIVIQRNASECQRLAHVFLLSRSISRRSLARALSKVLV